MRLLEIVLSVANLLAFCALASPRLRAVHRISYVFPSALLIAVLQIVLEGSRWQVYPAYTLTIIFFLVWLFGTVIPGRRHVYLVVSFFGTGIGALVLVISIAMPVLLPVFHFPKPSGQYAIGTVTYHWIDTSRPELFTSDPNEHRELTVQVWYPAKNEPEAPGAPYIQDADTVTPEIGRLLHLPEFIFSHLKYVKTNAVALAPIADEKANYPVLIYLTGVDGFRSVNTFQVEDLVSHGYIVAGIDQPGIAPLVRLSDGRKVLGLTRDKIQPMINQSVEPQPKVPVLNGKALPDGIIPYFAQDAIFTLDQLTDINKNDPKDILTGRLDLGHVGTFGVSLGGMNVAEVCLKDPRFKAGLIMDVWMPNNVVKAGLKQPIMFLTRDANSMRLEGWSEHDIALTVNTMRAVYGKLPGDGYYAEIMKMFHANFTDIPYWSPTFSVVGMTGPINGQRGFDIVNAYSIAFFDKELRGQASALLIGTSKLYPQVIFENLQH